MLRPSKVGQKECLRLKRILCQVNQWITAHRNAPATTANTATHANPAKVIPSAPLKLDSSAASLAGLGGRSSLSMVGPLGPKDSATLQGTSARRDHQDVASKRPARASKTRSMPGSGANLSVKNPCEHSLARRIPACFIKWTLRDRNDH